MAKTSTLQDLFNGPALDTSKWGLTFGASNSPTVTYGSTGVTMAYPSSSTASTSARLISNATFDLTASEVYVCVTSIPANSANSALFVRSANTDWSSSDWIRIISEVNYLFCQKRDNGTITSVFNFPYVSSTTAWWRIRHSSGSIYFYTSADGKTWTQQATTIVSTLDLTNVYVGLEASCYNNQSNPGNFRFHSLNIQKKGIRVRNSGVFVEKPTFQKISGVWRQVDVKRM